VPLKSRVRNLGLPNFYILLVFLILGNLFVFTLASLAPQSTYKINEVGSTLDFSDSAGSLGAVKESFTPVFQRGTSYTAWSYGAYNTSDSDESLFRMSRTNTEWVAINVWWFQDNLTSTRIYPRPDLYSASNGSVIHAINRTHELGMKVMLKPVVDPIEGGWRGEIPPSDEWFASYANFINFFAEMAETYGVELFCVGCEFNSNQGATAKWEEIVSGVRARYSGPITYAANHDSYQNVGWWSSLDYVGIDAYFRLTNKNDPTVEELKAAWSIHADAIESWQSTIGKPVIFTELGYRSGDGANKDPSWWGGHLPVDLQEQVDCYNATLQTFWNRSWFYGFYWWNWETDPDAGGPDDDWFTPQNKPVQDALTGWYAPGPKAHFTYSPPYPVINWTVTLNASASKPDIRRTATISNYTWDFGDGNNITTTNSTVTHEYAVNDTYTLTLNVTDSQGLWNTTSKMITVILPGQIDAAVVNVTPHPAQGYPADRAYPYWYSVPPGRTRVLYKFNVTVQNEGVFSLTCDVTAHYKNLTYTGTIGTETVSDLAPGQNRTLSFTWDLTGLPASTKLGNIIYTLSANITTIIPGETNLLNNYMTDGSVEMLWPGNTNGDDEVSIADVGPLVIAWKSNPGDAKWDARCDYNRDGEIDTWDVSIIIFEWGAMP